MIAATATRAKGMGARGRRRTRAPGAAGLLLLVGLCCLAALTSGLRLAPRIRPLTPWRSIARSRRRRDAALRVCMLADDGVDDDLPEDEAMLERMGGRADVEEVPVMMDVPSEAPADEVAELIEDEADADLASAWLGARSRTPLPPLASPSASALLPRPRASFPAPRPLLTPPGPPDGDAGVEGVGDSARNAYERVRAGEATLLDLRPPRQFEAERVPGSTHVPAGARPPTSRTPPISLPPDAPLPHRPPITSISTQASPARSVSSSASARASKTRSHHATRRTRRSSSSARSASSRLPRHISSPPPVSTRSNTSLEG